MEDITQESATKLEAHMFRGPGCRADAIRAANRWLWEAENGAIRLLEGAREVLERIAQHA